MRRRAEDDTPNRADDPLAVGVGKRLAANDEGLHDQATHAVRDEEQRLRAEPSVSQFLGEVPGSISTIIPGFAEFRDPSRIADRPNATIREIFAQGFRPEKCPGFSSFAMSPSAVRRTA
jgi:hypothetical protein